VFEGKKILITGGTGSLGNALTKRLLESDVDTIRIFSRNEDKQVKMRSEFKDEDRLRFLIGDIRDLPRLHRAFEDIDIVFHAAALKHVPVVAYNPFEAVKTNVIGSQNIIDASLHENIELAVAVGTDKAVSPLNTYGATKLLMEKLFVTANNYINPAKHKTKFVALRYGNVLGSSGSVVPLFINQIKKNQKITITDPEMTRFSITMNDALDFILESCKDAKGSEVFIPNLRAYTIKDIKNALTELLNDPGEEVIGIREGEKMHEILINHDEIRYSWKFNNKYVILNENHKTKEIQNSYKNISKVEASSEYNSHTAEKIPKEELKKIILNSGLLEIKH
jgi:UDP-N-acetylglucosamine 4,6-dehydratase/5-epimerase